MIRLILSATPANLLMASMAAESIVHLLAQDILLPIVHISEGLMQVMNNPLLLVTTIHDVIYLKDFLPCVNWHQNIECSHSEIRFEEILPTTIKREICKSKRKKHRGNREEK